VGVVGCVAGARVGKESGDGGRGAGAVCGAVCGDCCVGVPRGRRWVFNAGECCVAVREQVDVAGGVGALSCVRFAGGVVGGGGCSGAGRASLDGGALSGVDVFVWAGWMVGLSSGSVGSGGELRLGRI